MAHYAFINEDSIVVEVIPGRDEGTDNIDWEVYYGNFRGMLCKRTSYNTSGNVHQYGSAPFRKNYAGIGYSYDASRDAFIPPKEYNSWVLNEETCNWDPPIPYPDDYNTRVDGKKWVWNEETISWDIVNY